MRIATVISCTALILTTACGGSGASNQELLDDRIEGGDALDLAFPGQTASESSGLPGAATYTGVIIAGGGIIGENSEAREIRTLFVGDLSLGVDFGAGTLTGEGRDFIEAADFQDLEDLSAGSDASGTLAIEGTRNPGVDVVEFGIAVNGRIDGRDGAFLEFDDLETTAIGRGANAEAIGFEGTVGAQFDGEDGFLGVSGIAGR
jgi:hypothetical protein